MSVSDSSSILAGVDAGLAIALFAALLLPRVRTAMFPVIVAAIAASAGLVGGLYLSQAQGGPPPPPNDVKPRLDKIEHNTADLSRTVGQLRTETTTLNGRVDETTKRINTIQAYLLPRESPIPKLSIESVALDKHQVLLTFKNPGTERVTITGGDVSFCPPDQPIDEGNCKPAPRNDDCPRTFVCRADGMMIGAGQISRPKSATITYDRSPFLVRVALDCTDGRGRDCRTVLTSNRIVSQTPATSSRRKPSRSRSNPRPRAGSRRSAKG